MAFGKRHFERHMQGGCTSNVVIPVKEIGGRSQSILDHGPIVPQSTSRSDNEAKYKTNTIQDGNTETNDVQPGGAASDESYVSEDSDDELAKTPASAAVGNDKVCQNDNPVPVTSTDASMQIPVGEPRTFDVGDTVPQGSFEK